MTAHYAELDAILERLSAHRFLHACEADLQEGLEGALEDRFDVQREAPLDGRDHIDLLIGRVGIEVKVSGVWRVVRRQLERYAASDAVDALILVTAKPLHKRAGGAAHGKPIYVHLVGSSL